MMRGRSAPVVVAFVVALAGACSPYVSRGSSLYWDGRFIEAAEVFERTESRVTRSEPRVQAEYGLYRGLTFLRLGDLAGARQWLSFASKVERQTPGILAADERRILEDAWAKLEISTREAPPVSGAMATASAPSSDMSVRQDTNGQRFVSPPASRSPLVPR